MTITNHLTYIFQPVVTYSIVDFNAIKATPNDRTDFRYNNKSVVDRWLFWNSDSYGRGDEVKQNFVLLFNLSGNILQNCTFIWFSFHFGLEFF